MKITRLPSKNFIILANRSNPKYLYSLLTLSSFMSLLLGWFNSAGYMNSAFWWIPRKTRENGGSNSGASANHFVLGFRALFMLHVSKSTGPLAKKWAKFRKAKKLTPSEFSNQRIPSQTGRQVPWTFSDNCF